MKWVSRAIFSTGSRQEVNSTWYPEIEEPIKSREITGVVYTKKGYFTGAYRLIFSTLLLLLYFSDISQVIGTCAFIGPYFKDSKHELQCKVKELSSKTSSSA